MKRILKVNSVLLKKGVFKKEQSIKVESDINVKMPPIKKYPLKVKVLKIVHGVPRMDLPELI
jgi:hypothetical protein